MKDIKKLSFASIASATVIALTPTLSMADSQNQAAASAESGNLVHRVSHTLANTQQYTGNVASGYKWGEDSKLRAPKPAVAEVKAEQARSGFKWGEALTPEQSGNKWGRRDFPEQSGNKWGRRDFSEQSGNKWGRRDFSEQSGNKWGRR